jgi:hypothetical protein
MSFMNYLQTKNRKPSVTTSLEAYRERLSADVASLLIKPDAKLHEARKNLVNMRDFSRALSELHYPLAEEFRMAVRTGDPKKVSHAHMTFRKWAEYSRADRDLTDQVETALFHYQTKLYGHEFNPDDADEVVKSALAESQAMLDRLAHNIELAIEKLPHWHGHPVVLEALCPEGGWVVEGAHVTVGEAFRAGFDYVYGPLGYRVENVKRDGLPASLLDDIKALVARLQQNPKYNKILTLYMARPISERRYFELAKRDVSLGISTVLPGHVKLSASPDHPDKDVWKVRVEDKHLRESAPGEYHVIGDEAPIRWIELYQKG